VNTALAFDGIDDFVDLADDGTFDFTSALTFEAWIKPDASNASLDAVVGGYLQEPPAFAGASWILSPTVLSVSVPNTDSAQTATPIVPDQWIHIAGTYDGVTMVFYQNGQPVASKAHGTGRSTTPIAFLALGVFSTNHYGGLIDEVRLWNVVRTPAEILASDDHSLTGTEAGLVGYWKFDVGAGQTASSSAGAAHPLRLGTSIAADASDPTWVLSDVPLLD
jgi:hypothetical protein